MLQMLERCAAQPIQSEEAQFAETVREKLGYKLPQNSLPADDVKLYQKIQLMPFTPESVERYKAKAKRKAENGEFGKAVANLGGGLMIISLLALFFGWVSCFLNTISGVKPEAAELGYLLTIGGLALLLVTGCMFWFTSGLAAKATWKTMSLREYISPVPEFVLQTAVDIQSQNPHAKFFIHYLETEKMTVDPFLIVILHPDGSRHRLDYIEVWNEPGFKGKRMV
jgi:hypothetical protein